jgi:hypothetical protein
MLLGGAKKARTVGKRKKAGKSLFCSLAALTSKAEDNIMRPLCRDPLL